MMVDYNPQEIEQKWQRRWAEDNLYRVDRDDSKPKWYALTMFPYTSGDLHIGHWYAMAPADVHARFKRMQGYNVLHPMGFDAFGLPAENAAIKHGIHPYTWTMQNVENMRRQLKSLGAIYDWDREVITCLPDYYKWTQWFFLKLYENGLAYREKAPVNWCSQCQAVLANEQVVDGEWFFRITRYAEEMKTHQGIDWPGRIETMQENWVGRSEGTELSFALDHPGVDEKEIRVFTTRPDTAFGVTFMVLAPEHPLVEKLTASERRADVEAYIARTRKQTEIERLSTEREKDGVFTGAYVVNRLNGEKVPVWIADYVLLSYGTGAVMAVPAHDERDFAFAKKYDLPIRVVITPEGWGGGELEEAYIEPGVMINSGSFDGLPSEEGKNAVSDRLEEKGWGKRAITYKLRDWLISRQRYWGAPIPMIYCPKCGIVPVPEEDLPVLLPENVELKPSGDSPLRHCDEFVNTTCPKCGGKAKRETDTMDTFMCSSWYFLRYISPGYDQAPFSDEDAGYWLPVDIYTGGAEHAVMHLFYARFFIKALRDMGIIDFGEPFTRLFNQGVIIVESQKMSKSKGNVVNPDAYVSEMGADTVRAYLMFIAPWDRGGEWDDSGISGIGRWLKRVWSLALEPYQAKGGPDPDAEKELKRLTHQTIKKATNDMERLHFNTMISALMEYTNYLYKVRESGSASGSLWKQSIDALLLMLAPTAPHLAEELWQRTGHEYSIHNQRWPSWDEALAADEEITLVVQVNGKVRDKIAVPVSISEDEAKELALASQRAKPHLEGKKIIKTIYVPGKLVNMVVR